MTDEEMDRLRQKMGKLLSKNVDELSPNTMKEVVHVPPAKVRSVVGV